MSGSIYLNTDCTAQLRQFPITMKSLVLVEKWLEAKDYRVNDIVASYSASK